MGHSSQIGPGGAGFTGCISRSKGTFMCAPVPTLWGASSRRASRRASPALLGAGLWRRVHTAPAVVQLHLFAARALTHALRRRVCMHASFCRVIGLSQRGRVLHLSPRAAPDPGTMTRREAPRNRPPHHHTGQTPRLTRTPCGTDHEPGSQGWSLRCQSSNWRCVAGSRRHWCPRGGH